MTATTVRIYRDGDQTCAIIGQMPEHRAAGFGDDAKSALAELEKEMSRLEGVCPICWSETDRDEMTENTLYECPNCGWKYNEVHDD